jgi:hypothetical protein
MLEISLGHALKKLSKASLIDKSSKQVRNGYVI